MANRFHAWQSSLLFSAIFVLHLIFSWSAFISWTFLLCDVVLIGYLVRRAYADGMFSFCFFLGLGWGVGVGSGIELG